MKRLHRALALSLVPVAGVVGVAWYAWGQNLTLPRNGSMINLPEIGGNTAVTGIAASPNGTMSDGVHWYGAWEREPGAWSSPYPNYVLSNHTGIRLAASGWNGGVSVYDQLNAAGTTYSSKGNEVARFRDDRWGGSYFRTDLGVKRLKFGNWTDTGLGSDDYAIYQEGGPWSYPYPDLLIRYHTGIKYDAYQAYGGHRFYTGYSPTGPAGLSFSVGEGDTNTRVYGQLHLNGGTLYSPGRLHISGAELLYVLNTSGMVIGREWGGTGNLTVQGNLSVAGVKNFVQPHPTDKDKEIAFVSLEGPEAGTYCRGSSRFAGGKATIALPESFALTTGSKGLTAQVTAVGKGSGLYVIKKTTRELVVGCDDGARCPAELDWQVNGVRSGYEDHQAIRPRTKIPAPSQPSGVR